MYILDLKYHPRGSSHRDLQALSHQGGTTLKTHTQTHARVRTTICIFFLFDDNIWRNLNSLHCNITLQQDAMKLNNAFLLSFQVERQEGRVGGKRSWKGERRGSER